MIDLFNYRKADYSKVSKDISHYMGLSDKDRDYLEEYLRYSPYIVVSTKRENPKTTFLQRLSIPIWFLITGILVLSMPFKWVFTGIRHYDPNTRFMKFMINWVQKLF